MEIHVEDNPNWQGMNYDRIVNLTPHRVRIFETSDAETPVVELESTGEIARCKVERTPAFSIDIGAPNPGPADNWPEIPVSVPSFGQVVNLPEPQPGVWYVVSAMVREAVRHRDDVLSPGEPRRDAAGNVIGCVGLDANPVV